MSDRIKFMLVLVAALVQGLLYLFLLPPWQHYDEPSHFEYAWLIAQRGSLPTPHDTNDTMRRDVLMSMIEHNFYSNGGIPEWIGTGYQLNLGYSQLPDLPTYYLLVSLPLRVVGHLDVTSQLYVARMVSLLLFLLTIAIAGALARDLTPPRHMLRWAVPLGITLMPPFVDVMTAVNNDVGAVFAVALFLWGSVRTIRFGFTPWRVLWLVGTAVLGIITKNASAIALLLLPVTVLVAIWTQRRWRWRWLVLGAGATLVALPALLLDWTDAAAWYPAGGAETQAIPTRSQSTTPGGRHTLNLELTPGTQGHLLNPLLDEQIRSVVGHTITLGGWVSADRTATIAGPSLLWSRLGVITFESETMPVTVTTTPTFVAWTFDVPADVHSIQYALLGKQLTEDEQPLRIMLDRPFLVDGAFPTGVEPIFDDASAVSGSWAGQAWTNLLRNPSGQRVAPRPKPWLNRLLARVLPRPPAQMIMGIFDVSLTWPHILQVVAPNLLRGTFTGFAWAHVGLFGNQWCWMFGGVMLVALTGCLRWFAQRAQGNPTLRPALLLLLVAALLAWGNALIWVLPMLWARTPVPAARYTFPATIPLVLALVAGWWALWPRRYRAYGALALLCLLLILNGISVWTIRSFYESIPSRVAEHTYREAGS